MWNIWEDWNDAAAPNNPRTYTRGMFTARHNKSIAWATDGTSNTVAASERCCSDTEGNATTLTRTTNWVRAGCTQGNNPSIYSGGNVTPANCLQNAPSAGDRTILANPGLTWAGQLFGDGRPINGGFNTVLPPNSPSCGYTTTGGGDGWGVISVTSYHKGGVNTVFLDGSVRFIPDTINCGNLNGPQGGTHEGTGTQPVSSGESSYGVWGAMGTPAGGESKSM
jgi:prepilin-type processing-associated H-X9-DG protein